MKSLNIKFVTFSYTPKNPNIYFPSLSLSLFPLLLLLWHWVIVGRVCTWKKYFFSTFYYFTWNLLRCSHILEQNILLNYEKCSTLLIPLQRVLKKWVFCQPEAKKNRKWIWMWHFYICNGFKFKTYPTTKTYQNMFYSYHKIQNVLKAR